MKKRKSKKERLIDELIQKAEALRREVYREIELSKRIIKKKKRK